MEAGVSDNFYQPPHLHHNRLLAFVNNKEGPGYYQPEKNNNGNNNRFSCLFHQRVPPWPRFIMGRKFRILRSIITVPSLSLNTSSIIS